jgi:hypothetical protein
MTATSTAQGSLGLSYTEYTSNNTLQDVILEVVDAIVSQDSTDRGAWTVVIAKRISLEGFYSESKVKREIKRMLKANLLYENVYEILNGIYPIVYVRNANDLLGGD